MVALAFWPARVFATSFELMPCCIISRLPTEMPTPYGVDRTPLSRVRPIRRRMA